MVAVDIAAIRPGRARTAYFSPAKPAGAGEGNWIETVPGKGWFVILRLYSPLEPFFAKTWRPGEIEPVTRDAELKTGVGR